MTVPEAGPSTSRGGDRSQAVSQPRYHSSFRPASLANALLRPGIEYVLFKFKKTICMVDSIGIPSLAKLDVEDEIMVSKNWQLYKASGKPKGGWLGSGSSKYAFEVCFQILFDIALVSTEGGSPLTQSYRCD